MELYKDEVRVLGEQLGLPARDRVAPAVPRTRAWPCAAWVARARRPSSRRACRCRTGVSGWIVPVRTVGVQGDERSYSRLLAVDGFADAETAGAFARRITNEHRAINRVALVASRRDGQASRGWRSTPATLTRERITLLREADDVVTRIVRKHALYDAIWQFPVAMIPLGSAPGRETIVLRPVNSRDGMTADFAQLPPAVIDEIAAALAQLERVDAVLYDVTNKPPATIELE